MINAPLPALLFSNGAGDHLLNLPAVRALVHLFPQRLALVCQNGARSTFFPNLQFRRTCEVPVTINNGARFFDADRVASAITPCDLLISLNPWHSSSVDRLLERLAPRASIGFYPQFQRQVKLDFDKHSVDLAFDIPRALDPSLKLDDFSGPPVFSACCVKQGYRVRRLIPPGFRVLAVHADTRLAKMWPRRRFVKLLDLFLQRRPDFIALLLGWDDMRLDVGSHAGRVVPCYRLPFATTALLVGWSDLFVGVDSSLLHAADLFRVPGVGLFGPTSAKEFGFRFAPHRHACPPSGMSSLRESAVMEALEDLLAEVYRRTAKRASPAFASGQRTGRENTLKGRRIPIP